MPQFEMNTSGVVTMHEPQFAHVAYGDLCEFAQGYVECLFFADNAPGETVESWQATEEHDGGSFPEECDFGDLAPETLAKILADCAKFQADNVALLGEAYACEDYEPRQAGRDFWYTRNGHGVGFRDRNQLLTDNTEEYEALTAEMVAAGANSKAWDAALAKRNAIEADSVAMRLYNACKSWRQLDAYLGDDGKIYF